MTKIFTPSLCINILRQQVIIWLLSTDSGYQWVIYRPAAFKKSARVIAECAVEGSQAGLAATQESTCVVLEVRYFGARPV